MISGLTIHNFKCFADQRVALAPLTLLVGANASGKSSVIQALLLLRQSHLRGALARGELLLNGRLTSLGTTREVFSQWPTDDTLGFTIDTAEGVRFTFSFDYIGGQTGQRTFRGVIREHDGQLNLFGPRFNYLNAERIGPQLLYPMPEDDRSPSDVGIHGEYAAHLVAGEPAMPIANKELAYPSYGADSPLLTVFDQTRHWMRQIVPNFDYRVNALDEADQISVLFSSISGQEPVRPTNIGFGLIYTLPIVVAALVAPAGSLLIVENPEAHLHPASQSAMGRFLARVAAAGVQVIIETHSDHILNGIRVAVRRAILPADLVAIQYFASEATQGPPTLYTPRLYPSGGITPWPAGFFDQQDNDLAELL